MSARLPEGQQRCQHLRQTHLSLSLNKVAWTMRVAAGISVETPALLEGVITVLKRLLAPRRD